MSTFWIKQGPFLPVVSKFMFDKCFGSEEISHKILLFRGRISITASVELLIQQINNTDVVVYIQVVEKWLSNLKLRNKVRLRFKKYYNLKIINANKQCDTTNQQYWGFCLCSDHWKRIFEPEINKNVCIVDLLYHTYYIIFKL